MDIIIGHTNLDLDCIGSMVLARRLFPDHKMVRSGIIHPVARNLYNLYQNHLDFTRLADIRTTPIDHIVIVDTRSIARVKQLLREIDYEHASIDVFDHHPADSADIPTASIHEAACGANTTLLELQVARSQVGISTEDATIALAGICADTANFTHEDVTEQDFEAAAFLMRKGASPKIVKTLLQSLRADHQLSMLHQILNHLVYKNYHGHFVLLSRIELDKQVGGLAAVAEKVFEIENPDAYFGLFAFAKNQDVLIIARSRERTIDLHEILEHFGGGGHAGASTALLKKTSAHEAFAMLNSYLESTLRPAVTAEQIMTHDVSVVPEDFSLMEASISLEQVNHTGTPVTDAASRLTGFLTLRDIMKGRKANQMHAPVKAYMTRRVISATKSTTIREIEQLLFKNNIGHLPIVQDGRAVGIVTRSDYLRFVEQQQKAP